MMAVDLDSDVASNSAQPGFSTGGPDGRAKAIHGPASAARRDGREEGKGRPRVVFTAPRTLPRAVSGVVAEAFWPRGGWVRAFHYVKHRMHRLPGHT